MDSDRQGQGEGSTPQEAVRDALERAISAAEGIVALEVRRPGQQAVRARLAQITWAAVWDALALDPQDEEWDDGADRVPDVPAGVAGARFAREVERELGRARVLFPRLHSSHEGLGVLLEEFREVERAVYSKEADTTDLYAELVQLAAMARRMVEDLDL